MNRDYFEKKEFVSGSMLKDLRRSPRVFEAKHITRTIRDEPSAAMRLGTAIHAAILEPDKFKADYVCVPDDCRDRRTKRYKEWASSLGENQEVITGAESYVISRCTGAARANPGMRRVLSHPDTLYECEVYFRSNGAACKAKLDIVNPTMQLVVDLKSIGNIDGPMIATLAKTAAQRDFGIQATHYVDAAAFEFGGDGWAFLFCALETQSPHRCRLFKLDKDAMEFSDAMRCDLIRDYVNRLEANDWSEPAENEVVDITLPNWYTKG